MLLKSDASFKKNYYRANLQLYDFNKICDKINLKKKLQFHGVGNNCLHSQNACFTYTMSQNAKKNMPWNVLGTWQCPKSTGQQQ